MAQPPDLIVVEPSARTLLEASEARLRLALQAANIGIWDWDVPTGRMVYSARARELCGFAPDQELTLEDVRAVTHPDDLPITWAQRERAFDPAIRDRSAYEYRIVRTDGAVRWVRAYGEVIFRDVEGEPAAVRYTGTLEDITERRELEEERRRSEERLRELNASLETRVAERTAERNLLALLVQTTDAFIQAADRDFNLLAINRAASEEFARIFGVRAPQRGDNMLELSKDKPEHREAVRAIWSRALAGEEFEEVGEFGAVDRRAYRMRYNALRDEAGALIGAFQIVTDVTDELRQQAALAEAEAARREADALYRAYFENTADPLFVVSVEDDGLYVVEQTNPAHEAAFGFACAEVRGRPLHELLPPHIFDQVSEHYRRCAESGAVIQFRDSFDMPDGVRHADTVLVPMRDESGRIVRIMGSSRDVTRQVQAEDALRQAQKMEAVGQLTGGIAHDFNNLLGAIMGGFDLIRRKAGDAERVRRLADSGLEAAERGARLTSQLLAFARAQRLEMKPLVVSTLVRNLGDLLAGTLGPMIRLRYDLDDQVRPVLADRTQLEMAVLNLAINARDAMPEGGGLTIATRLRRIGEDHELEPGDYVELAVADTGAGMTPEVAARALDPFFTTKGWGRARAWGSARSTGWRASRGARCGWRAGPARARLCASCCAAPPASLRKRPAPRGRQGRRPGTARW